MPIKAERMRRKCLVCSALFIFLKNEDHDKFFLQILWVYKSVADAIVYAITGQKYQEQSTKTTDDASTAYAY